MSASKENQCVLKRGKDQDEEFVLSEMNEKRRRDVLEISGSNGLWQFRVFLVLFVISIPGAGQNLAVSFMAPDIDYWCAKPPAASNLSTESWKKIGLPTDDKHCYRYANVTFSLDENCTSTVLPTLPCKTWEYDHSFYSSTLKEEFDLVCSREWLISFSKSIFMVGVLASQILFGGISDKVGRRPTIAGCCVITFVSAMVCAFSPTFTLFLIARFFVAFGVGGYWNNLFVLLSEVVGPEVRSTYSNTVQLGWSLGFVSLPGIVWLIRDWFWIQIVLTAPFFVFLAVWWMIPESPRWLVYKGKTERAKEMLMEAAKMNKKDISDIDKVLEEIILAETKDNDIDIEESNGNMLDLLKTPGLRQTTLNIVFSWFVISFIYYGLSFNTNDLAGDPFVNFAASGIVEFPAYGFSIITIRYFGRKKSLTGTMIAGGLTCLLSYFVPEDSTWLATLLPVAGKFFITTCYGILYVFTIELFPTVIRSSGLGVATFFEQIGSIIAPFTRELGYVTQPFVPFCLYGILACGSGLLTLLLPETANQKIPDTLKEVAAIRRR